LIWFGTGTVQAVRESGLLCEYHFQLHAAMCLNVFRLASVVFPEDDLVFQLAPPLARGV
jgi:hypothetical protein